MRKLAVGVAAGIVLVLAAATGVSAYWQAQQRLDLSATTSGELRIAATWRDGTPTWTPLFPGQSTTDAVVRVTSSSMGSTLRWRLTVTGTVAPELQSHVTFTAWRDTCGTGAPIPASGISGLTPDAAVDVCVRFTLSSSAPSSLQGKSLQPSVSMRADQVAS